MCEAEILQSGYAFAKFGGKMFVSYSCEYLYYA